MNIKKSELHNKDRPLVVISGGTSGLGAQVAEFLKNDYDLALIFKNNRDKANACLDTLTQNHPFSVEIFEKEVVDHKTAQEVYNEIKFKFNRIPHALINCQGDTKMGLLLNSSVDEYENIFKSHFFGVVALTKAVAEDMYSQKFGRVINISSIAQNGNRKGQSAYGSAKAAIESFTKSISTELYHRKITVNCIRPGLLPDKETEKKLESLGKVTYLEISELIYFLIKPSSGSITGSIFVIDAGAGSWITN